MADAQRLFYQHLWPHRATILRTARFLTRNHAEADDLAQETLVKAFKSISQFDPSTSAKSWLTAILRHSWIDRLRATSRRGDVSLDDSDLPDPHGRESFADPADLADPAALLEQFADADLISALRKLPEEIRWTLLLVDVEQIDHVDAARILDIPPGTVKSRAHRGRRMLREALSASRQPSVEDSK